MAQGEVQNYSMNSLAQFTQAAILEAIGYPRLGLLLSPSKDNRLHADIQIAAKTPHDFPTFPNFSHFFPPFPTFSQFFPLFPAFAPFCPVSSRYRTKTYDSPPSFAALLNLSQLLAFGRFLDGYSTLAQNPANAL